MESWHEKCSSTRTVLRYTGPLAMAAIQKYGFQLVEDPPFLLIWLPLTTTFSWKLKKELSGLHIARDDDVMNDVDHFLRDQNGAFYKEGIRLLHDCWTKCVNVVGDYVEKWLHLVF